MPNINISVKNKIAIAECGAVIVCKNGDYVAVFDFDEQWEGYIVKTAKFAYGDDFIPVVFYGNQCAIPKLPNTYLCGIEVEAGNVRTATPAWVECLPVLDDSYGEIEPPSEDVYHQIMQMIKDGVLTGAKIVETIYIGKDENGGNVYKQIFDNGTENYFTAPKGTDSKFIIGEDSGTAYDGAKGAKNARDILAILDEITKIYNSIAINSKNISQNLDTTNKKLDKKLEKSNNIANGNIVEYDSENQAIRDSGISKANVTKNASDIAIQTRKLNDESLKVAENATEIKKLSAQISKSSVDISQNKTSISQLADFVNDLSVRVNAVLDSDDVTLDQLSEIVEYIKNNKGLIDTITTQKVNYTDIIDNLTSASAKKVLSANQGRVLNELVKTVDDTLTDLKTFVERFEWNPISNSEYTISVDSLPDYIEFYGVYSNSIKIDETRFLENETAIVDYQGETYQRTTHYIGGLTYIGNLSIILSKEEIESIESILGINLDTGEPFFAFKHFDDMVETQGWYLSVMGINNSPISFEFLASSNTIPLRFLPIDNEINPLSVNLISNSAVAFAISSLQEFLNDTNSDIVKLGESIEENKTNISTLESNQTQTETVVEEHTAKISELEKLNVKNGSGENSIQIKKGRAVGDNSVDFGQQIDTIWDIITDRDEIWGVPIHKIVATPNGFSIPNSDEYGDHYYQLLEFESGESVSIEGYSGYEYVSVTWGFISESGEPDSIHYTVNRGDDTTIVLYDNPESPLYVSNYEYYSSPILRGFVELHSIKSLATGALGENSVAFGVQTTANANQTALGKRNKAVNGALLMIGNGSVENQEDSNAFVVMEDGTVYAGESGNRQLAFADQIGDIASALDELHAYAQNLVSGVSE